MNKWTLNVAANLIRIIHPSVFIGGYNLHLGGGVLDKGHSNKDLDIVAIRRPQELVPLLGATLTLLDIMGFKLEKTDNEIPDRVVYKLKQEEGTFKRLNGLAIDLIILNLEGTQKEPYFHRTDKEGAWSKTHLEKLEKLSAKAIKSKSMW